MASVKRKVLNAKENINEDGQTGPPKPPRTAFMCFSDATSNEILAQHQNDSEKEMIARVALAWKNLTRTDRARWDEAARLDKTRYAQQKASYKGPWDIPKRRKKKHPMAPKRPMSAFLKYSKTRRSIVKSENPDMGNTDVSRLLGAMWRGASKSERAPYVDQELVERAAYKVEIEKFNLGQERLDAATRTHHGNFHEEQQQQQHDESPPQHVIPPPHYHHAAPPPAPLSSIFQSRSGEIHPAYQHHPQSNYHQHRHHSRHEHHHHDPHQHHPSALYPHHQYQSHFAHSFTDVPQAASFELFVDSLPDPNVQPIFDDDGRRRGFGSFEENRFQQF